MPSAVRPTNVARVTMQMKSNLLNNGIRSNSVDLLKVQDQLTTGLRLSRPSDDPAAASTITHLDSVLERYQQYTSNINYSIDYLAVTDDALGQAGDLADQAYTLALGSIGTSADESGREANAIMIDQILQQMVTISNHSSRGSYVFGGQNTTTTPFEAYKGGVLFSGDISDVQTRVSQDNLLAFNVDGQEAFGSLSTQVIGIADLNPNITEDTYLSDLNGALNEGIRLSTIRIDDGTDAVALNLTNCVTIGDVLQVINDNTPATTTATINAAGNGIELTSSAGNLTISDVGAGTVARDFGIIASGTSATVTGQDVDARLTLTTPVTALAGGAGIDTINGLKITNSLLEDVGPINLSTAQTLGDILSAINLADVGARASINADGTGINVLNQISGSKMSIGENGGAAAEQLGIRSMTGTTLLADLNGGDGVGTSTDSGPGELLITARDGSAYTIDLSGLKTVQDVIDKINDNLVNGGADGHVVASMATDGNGIVLTDVISGAGDLSVSSASSNGYDVAVQLGLNKTVSADSFQGDDVNGIEPDSLFSHLIALRDALRMTGDASERDAAISKAANAIQADRENISYVRGQVGSMMQATEDRRTHMEDNQLATETLRSDIRDIDFTEAITRYQNLYTALQANLTAGQQLTNMTLLDFLT